MVVLGISGADKDAAAALVVNGSLRAAATEESFARVRGVGYRQTGGFPFAATAACLERAGLRAADVTEIAVADADGVGLPAPPSNGNGHYGHAGQRLLDLRSLFGRPMRRVEQLDAHAALTAAADDGQDSLVLVLERERTGGGAVFQKQGTRLSMAHRVAGLDGLYDVAASFASRLGTAGDPYAALEELGHSAEPEFRDELRRSIRWCGTTGVRINAGEVQALLDGLDGGASLADVDSLNVHVQHKRAAVAAGFHHRMLELVGELAEEILTRTAAGRLGVGGGLFSSTRMTGRLRQLLGDRFYAAPLPEAAGLAIGAALSAASGAREPIRALALGPEFSEQEIKAALENCRLDYLYEPDWPRLLKRVSLMLSQGKTVAWFHGAMEFGPRSLGNRSVLADPSNRWARENINRYFKRRGDEHPLALSLSARAARECLDPPGLSPFMLERAVIKEPWREKLRAVLDARHTAEFHTVDETQAPELSALLEVHRERCGVPGLINTTLSADGEPTACTPRDAIRTTFSSAVDALVMGRFLVMKDFWLLRSTVES